jgi:prepilin-type N-terminal cleavage/methylation domain-containing protein
MLRLDSQGFSLIELAIVLVVLGIVAAFSVPGVVSLTQSMQLDSAAHAVAGQLQLARSKAMATGNDQTLHFSADSAGSDYHTHNGSGGIAAGWKFPAGITYETAGFQSVTMLREGRATTSAYIVLRDRRGDTDTVSVQTSGLVSVY